jgi:hypothetical protein
MKTKETVISIFNRFNINTDQQITYVNEGQERKISIDRFAYIIEQADENGLIHLPILESFDNANELLTYSSKLLERINKSINDGTFSPIYGDSYNLFGFVIEEDLYNGEDE